MMCVKITINITKLHSQLDWESPLQKRRFP